MSHAGSEQCPTVKLYHPKSYDYGKKRIGRSKKSVTVERSNPNGCAGLKKEIRNLPYSCNEHSVMQADR
jgi:hypothetical protein